MLRETGVVAWKRGDSEGHGYCLQIPRRLSHTLSMWSRSLQHNQRGDRKVGVKGEQVLPHYKEAVSKGQSCLGGDQLG